jgi:hypothetical protein
MPEPLSTTSPGITLTSTRTMSGSVSARVPILVRRTALGPIANLRCIDVLKGSLNVCRALPAPGVFLAGNVLATKELGWLSILIDLCVLLVLFVMLLVVTAPLWGLGVIYWRWRRGSRQLTAPQLQGLPCRFAARATKSRGRPTPTGAN